MSWLHTKVKVTMANMREKVSYAKTITVGLSAIFEAQLRNNPYSVTFWTF